MYKKKKKTRIAMRSNGPQKQVFIGSLIPLAIFFLL